MIGRSAPLLAAALGCLATPALAQAEADGPPPLPELVIPALPPLPEEPTLVPAPLEVPATDGGWQGEWQGEWAEDGTYHGTWSGTYSDPGPAAARAIYPGAGYGGAERTAWLNQCRHAYATSGAILAAQPAACENYLQQYERSYALAMQGAAPGAYAPGYGYRYAPVMWVRVPIIREPATPTAGH